MQDLWDRIDAVMVQIFARINADRDEDDWAEYEPDQLRGTTSAQLDKLEKLIGYPLPDDFRASYQIRDGFFYQLSPSGPRLNGCQRLLSLDGITHEVKFWGDYLKTEPDAAAEVRNRCHPEGPVAPIMWSKGWLPFVGEGTGNHLCLDLDPPAGGTVGQVFDFGHEEGPTRVHFTNFRAYMERFALDLETGAIQFDLDGNDGNYSEDIANFRQKNPGQLDPPAQA